jgi:hypothetical protein
MTEKQTREAYVAALLNGETQPHPDDAPDLVRIEKYGRRRAALGAEKAALQKRVGEIDTERERLTGAIEAFADVLYERSQAREIAAAKSALSLEPGADAPPATLRTRREG